MYQPLTDGLGCIAQQEQPLQCQCQCSVFSTQADKMDGMDELLQELNDLPGHARQSSLSAAAPAARISTSAGMPTSLGIASKAAVAPGALSARNMGWEAVQQVKLSSPATANRQRSTKSEMTLSTTSNPESQMARQDSLDDLLNDFDVPSGVTVLPKASSQQQGSNRRSQGSIAAKCVSVHIGGCGTSRGRNGSSLGDIICCDNLRCTKCDFKVLAFQHHAWREDCSYLFFRNTYPSDVHSMLVARQGASAYCCQCSWQTLNSTETVKVDAYAGGLRWVCGGHSN